MKNRTVLLVDAESFYASVEKADHPEIKHKPVIVSGDPAKRSGIILAACPLAKRFGVKTAMPLWEALRNCPNAVVMRPRMQHYLDVSQRITEIYERFTDLVEIFSIDEQFLDVTGSIGLFGQPHIMARKIQQTVMDETGVRVRVGIGPNKSLAKGACDAFAKKNQLGIFELNHENIKETYWDLPIGKMFGVGNRMENHLLRMAVRKIGHLANMRVETLRKRWGINGELLWQTANGIDDSPVTPDTHLNKPKAIGHGMTLPRDYRKAQDIRTVLLELCEEVTFQARSTGLMGATVSAGAQGVDFDYPTSFHRQKTLPYPTHDSIDLYHAAWDLFEAFWDRAPVRRVGVALSNLCQDDTVQMNLFSDQEKKRNIGYTVDSIKRRFGKTAIIHASSLTSAGLVFDRDAKIGGHYK